jgi:carbamoyl-phosphate synthase large subunit
MLKAGESVLVIGSGPIRIGQGCEFDYSCTQACRALKSEGLRVLLVNPNPATIMTDPTTADVVFLEPLQPDIVTEIIREHRPNAVLATMGGQEGLNLALELDRRGVLKKYGTELLGITTSTIEIAEDREKFKNLLVEQGIGAIPGCVVTTSDMQIPGRLEQLVAGMAFPMIIRASFTLGGGGGGVVRTRETLRNQLQEALDASSGHPVTVEQSVVGWREFELEVMSDEIGTFVVVAAVENINPMGVHTGDSVTVVPTFTLRDTEFQNMRDVAKQIFKALNMRIGGANIQFAIHPKTGEMVVVEMNPRVSRSSALVSKATGYPIAYISTKLALGHRLDNLTNEITGKTTAAYEPVIDYVAVKMPRFDFEKVSPGAGQLGIAMKSVGEVLSFGSSFAEAMTKAWRALELGFCNFPSFEEWTARLPQSAHLGAEDALKVANIATLPLVKSRYLAGSSIDEIASDTSISPFFLQELAAVFDAEKAFVSSCNEFAKGSRLDFAAADRLIKAGYSRSWFARVADESVADAVGWLFSPKFRLVDSCAAEFAAKTPYYFSTHHSVSDENRISHLRKRVVILGSGPNRIGQGIEFDYACVHAVQTLKAMGVQAIMVNCNPETVSTDYLEADKLYIEPLDDDAVLDILRVEKPAGVLLQFGGQSPLKLASKIAELGVPILGSSLASIDLCENRDAFESCLRKLGVASPASQSYDSVTAAEQSKAHMSYPVLVRPSYVIGGQGMSVVHSATELTTALARIQDVSPSNPLIVQEFLGDGVEFDVDIVTDAKQAVVVGILRHLDPPGIHSGDSVCEWLPREEIERDSNLLSLMETCSRLALDVGAVGLINVQCVMREKKIFVLEANPRCSRTVPFLAKIQHRKEAFPDAQGIIGAATRICLGASITELVKEGWSWLQSTQSGFLAENVRNPEVVPSSIEYAFKFPVFPYGKFESLAVGPGPEMHSLGEVMGRDSDRVRAFYKGALAAGWKFPDLKQPGVLDIWFDCAESQQAMQLILSELAFAIKSTAWELRIVADISELGEAGFVLAPSYLDACAKKPTLRGQIAQAIGRGVPAALSPQSAGLAIHAFCKHAHDREAQH